MNKEEYLKKLVVFNKKNNLVKRKLARDYLRANMLYSVGDVVEDRMGKILIDAYYCRGTIRELLFVYSGVRLTKRGKPYKSGETRHIYECNVIKGGK